MSSADDAGARPENTELARLLGLTPDPPPGTQPAPDGRVHATPPATADVVAAMPFLPPYGGPFAAPADIGTDTWLHTERRLSALAEVDEANLRWPLGHRPQELFPGDAASLLARAALMLRGRLHVPDHWQAHTDVAAGVRPARAHTLARREMHALAHAVTFYLPPSRTTLILGSHPPAPADLARVRMPAPFCLAMLPAPIRIDPDSPRVDHPGLRAYREGTARFAPGDEGTMDFLLTGRLSLFGFLYTADTDLALTDSVLLLAGTDQLVPGRPDLTIIGTESVSLTRSPAFADILANVAATIAYETWTVPDEADQVDLDAGARTVRAQVGKGRWRRRSADGASLGVRTVELGRRSSEARAASTVGPGRPRAAHFRRGHWRRVRVGPRTEWTYRLAQIDPTWVNADQADADTDLRVYRLPEPAATVETAPQTDD